MRTRLHPFENVYQILRFMHYKTENWTDYILDRFTGLKTHVTASTHVSAYT